MCEFNAKITIAQLLRLTIVSAKSKILSPIVDEVIYHHLIASFWE